MVHDGTIRLRDQRRPGHGWFDNEIYDVFGDELRQNGISVYMTLARLCYGVKVTMSLREMAGHARMSKDTFQRNLKRVIALGLVIEHKGATPQSSSTYALVDVKELAATYMRQATARERAQRASVSGRDSAKDVTLVQLLSNGAAKDDAQPPRGEGWECITVRHEAEPAPEVVEYVDKKNCAAPVATEVSQDVRHPHRQDTRPTRTQNNYSPLPPSRGVEGHACAEAVAKVMRECNLGNERLGPVIAKAMALEHAKSDAPPDCNATAERMIRSWEAFAQDAHLMRYQVGPKKFFEDGLWLGQRWPYDQQRLRDTRRL